MEQYDRSLAFGRNPAQIAYNFPGERERQTACNADFGVAFRE
jgi:hypothetical protein